MTEINENTTLETPIKEVSEETTEIVEKTGAPLTNSEYKVIVDSVKEFKEQYETLKSTVMGMITNLGLEENVVIHVLQFAELGIRNTPCEDLRIFLEDHQINIDERFDKLSDEEIYDMIEQINSSSMLLRNMEQQYKEIMNESGEIMNEYLQYMNSNKMNNTYAERINAMKAAAEMEVDSYKKGKIAKMVKALESCTTYSYLFDRFNYSGIEKEAKNLKETFFDKRRSKYVIDKYMSKMEKFGFKPQVFRYFFNIEENFLPEKYHVFNNFFLFFFMRFISYADPYSKEDQMVVKSFTGSLTNLIYHRFDSNESESEFIAAICKLLDLFEEYSVFFEINNSTHPKHPVRLSREREQEEEKRQDCINTMNKMHIEGYDPEWDSKKLMEYMNSEIERLEKLRAQQEEEDKRRREAAEEEELEEEYDEDDEDVEEEVESETTED